MNPNSKSPLNRVTTAIRILAPNSSYHLDGDKITEWLTPDIPQPSEVDIEAKVAEYKIEYDALEYARKREAEYPTVEELTIAQYDAADKAALVTKRAAVKTKWPKDNSGPIE